MRTAGPPKEMPQTPDPYLRHEDRGFLCLFVYPQIRANKGGINTSASRYGATNEQIFDYRSVDA
jgi:hypothetical protein